MHGAKSKGLVALIGIAVANMLISCGNIPDTAPTNASIVISSANDSTIVDSAVQFAVTAIDESGDTVTETPTWSVIAGGGTISSTGLFTAGDSAATFVNTIQATVGTQSARRSVVVKPGPLARIVVTSNTETVQVDETQQYTGVGYDKYDNVVQFVHNWLDVDGGGTIDSASGVFTAGHRSGNFEDAIRLGVGRINGFGSPRITPGSLTSIDVTPDSLVVGDSTTTEYTATGRDVYRNRVSITPVWSLSMSAAGVISQDGMFLSSFNDAVYPNGIVATSGSINGFATVEVNCGC